MNMLLDEAEDVELLYGGISLEEVFHNEILMIGKTGGAGLSLACDYSAGLFRFYRSSRFHSEF